MSNAQKNRNRLAREETLEAAMFEVLACAERFADREPETTYGLAQKRRVLLTAARSYARALEAVERNGAAHD